MTRKPKVPCPICERQGCLCHERDDYHDALDEAIEAKAVYERDIGSDGDE
jgi:hypothetical protein